MASSLEQDPESPEFKARLGLTLMAAKAALAKWQGHLRRAALLGSEDEYALALSLVPQLPHPAAYQARTLRPWADLCAAQGRLDEAAALFEKVATGSGRLSEAFWRDYALLLFRLAQRRVGSGQVAAANSALERAAQLLAGPADLPEAWQAALDGYAETALWFERAASLIPASLYGERAFTYAGKLNAWPALAPWLRKWSQAALQKSGVERALHWLGRWQALSPMPWPEARALAVHAAQALAQAEWALGRGQGAKQVMEAAEAWLKAAGPESPALADHYMAWGLGLGAAQGREQLDQALQMRRRLLGNEHPKTREAEQALHGLAAAAVPVDGTPRAWDGGAHFDPGTRESSLQAEAKRLHRRLAQLCHPDAALDPQDAAQRHDLMVRVNAAGSDGDVFRLRSLLREALQRQHRAAGPAASGEDD